MIRLEICQWTGLRAENLAVARNLGRKIEGSQRQGECVLVDFEGVEVSRKFLGVLLRKATEDKVKCCGLPIPLQAVVRSLLTTRESRV